MTKPATAGYSGKPLFAKLGFKPGWRVGVIGPPDNYGTLVAGAEDIRFVGGGQGLEAVDLFLPGPEQIADHATTAIGQLRDGGRLWVSWMKKSYIFFNVLTEGTLCVEILRFRWVDVKVCAVDSDWSALKFLKRKG